MSEVAVGAPVVEPAGVVVEAVAAAAAPLGREVVAEPADGAIKPSWMDGFSDELKADKALAVFKSPEDLAKSYLETKKMVGNRIELPKADDPDSFLRFAAAVRPEKAEDYTVEVPEGQDASFAEAMRPVFHDAGLHPAQVERLVKANNQYIAAQQAGLAEAGAAELAEIESGMGKADFEAAKLATNAWLTRMGIPVAFDTDLARLVGAGNSVRLLFDIAKRTGELGKVSDTDMALALNAVSPAMAQSEADAIVRDPKSAAILNGPDSAEKTALRGRLAQYIKIIEASQQ